MSRRREEGKGGQEALTARVRLPRHRYTARSSRSNSASKWRSAAPSS
jgi:hypothetical protein